MREPTEDGQKLMRKFKAAYSEMVKVVEEGTMRFRDDKKHGVSLRIQDAVTKSVKTYNKTELQVKATLKGIERHIYEKDHPGRIEKEKMRVEKVFAEGRWREL
eukprot:1031771-Pyramimonas_sp.AAC.1